MNRYKPYRRASTCVLFFVVLFTALGLLVLNAPSRAAASSTSVSIEHLLNSDGTLNLHTGFSGALDLRGWNVTLDSKRGPILTRASGGEDRSQTGTPRLPQSLGWFQLLHSPMTGFVNAIALVGSDMYIAGNFTFIPDGGTTNLHNIAKYSGGVWSALAHNGTDNGINALAVMGSDLYVGGSLSATADGAVTNLNNIAKYDTVGQVWTGLANSGIGGTVWSLAVIGSDLYVGGNFISTAAAPFVPNLNFIAKYSGGTWVALANHGLNGIARALTVSGSDLYVGGQFDFTNDMAVTNLRNIAKYSGGTWSALADQGLNGVVLALTTKGSDLYVGGAFTQTYNSLVTNLNHIARYDISGGTWSALAHHGLNGNVVALAVSGNDLYAGGYFAKTFDNAVTNLNYIARYDTGGGAWSALPNQGLSNPVLALASNGTEVYVGGDFGGTFDGQYLGQIVRLGSGFNVDLPLILR